MKPTKFVLGVCACGCGESIKIRSVHDKLQRFKMYHPSCTNRYNPAWRFQGKGYLFLYKPEHPSSDKSGYIREHRVIWEQYHKACLLPWGVIHHINGNKKDNRIENLELTNHRTHPARHTKDMSGRKCLDCNRNKTYVGKRGDARWHKHLDDFLCSRCYTKRYKLNKK